jgi:hypothetical protein
MPEIVALEAAREPLSREAILQAEGIGSGRAAPDHLLELVEQARTLYRSLAEPRGILASISPADFLEVYEGEGENAVLSPLPGIAGRAGHLALFAATLGDPLCESIRALFARDDPALGYMLDVIASERADALADLLAGHFRDALVGEGVRPDAAVVLPYSPGYCGWHVSGQRRLFAHLEPERIGIILTSLHMMTPVKSVSGVLVAGSAQAHAFENDFEFCLDCATWSCRSRLLSLP